MATDPGRARWLQSEMANFLKQWREARGLTLDQVGAGIGTDKTQVSKLEKGERKLSTDWLERFAKFYNVSASQLLGPPDAQQTPTLEVQPATVAGQRLPAPSVASMPIDVPELGTAVGGNHGDFSLNGQVIDYKRRPPGILSNRSVFCIRVRGESMAPRFEEGDLIYVDPHRPTKGGDDVLVEMKPLRAGEPGNAYIKRLVSKTPTKLILRQFNPPDAKVELQSDKVLRVLYILTLADLVGV